MRMNSKGFYDPFEFFCAKYIKESIKDCAIFQYGND